MSDKEQQLRQVEKVAASTVLHGSESLCKLLRYLAHHAIERPGTPVKEYQIATEEFGRPPDFDPAVDSMVRVQAGRLRAKLLEYYAGEGTADSVRIELPPAPPSFSGTLTSRQRTSSPRLVALCGGSFSSLGRLAPGALSHSQNHTHHICRRSQTRSRRLPDFLETVSHRPRRTLVGLSNAAFVGRPETGMR